MAHDKEFTLFTYDGLAHELSLTYDVIYVDFKKAEQKSEGFILMDVSPCTKARHVDSYEPEHKISVTGNDKYVLNQWLLFLATGYSAPLYNYFIFTVQEPVKIPGAIDRYQNEFVRVLSVLEKVLSKREWLVGGKFTVADLVFASWNPPSFPSHFPVPPEFSLEKNFPAVYRWHNAMASRPAVKEVIELK